MDGVLTAYWFQRMPFVFDVFHQESVVKSDTSLGKQVLIAPRRISFGNWLREQDSHLRPKD